mgnify:CR=1 FL=1
MSNEVTTGDAIEQGVELASGIYLTTLGARIEGDVSLDEYVAAVERCQGLGNACAWALGDLLYYGSHRGDWGETYTQALALTQKSYWSLTQCVRVAKAYPTESRLEEVSWSPHREALAIPDMDQRMDVLAAAATTGQSAQDLRQQLATTRPRRTTVCPQCQYEW